MPEADTWHHHRREHDTAESNHRREHVAAEKALQLAVDTVDRRLGELNELRKEVLTDRALFMPRNEHISDLSASKAEYRAELRAMAQRLDSVEKLLDKAEGSLNVWRFLVATLGLGGIGAVVWALVNSAPT
jgi:heme oxygenase